MQDPTTFQVQGMMKPHFPEQEQLKCPRCDSTNTKFCYYNNYNLSQPRHFCKNCRRYWTKGGALRNIPVGGGTRKRNKRSSGAKRTASSPLPSISHHHAAATTTITTNVLGSDLTRVGANPGGQDPRVMSIGGSLSSLLTPSGHFGALLEGLNSNGPGLKVVQMGEFGGGSGPVENLGSGCTLGLDVQGNGGSEGFLALQNGDSSCWNGGHGWSDLAIYTPGSTFQ